ncbi:MAG: inositol monophosphatase family protein [Sphingobium sp.]
MMTLPDADFLNMLADAADIETMARFRTGIVVDAKSASDQIFDPVTDADRAAERAMRGIIEESFPHHAIIGEEFGASGEADEKWVLDPIDGTRPFICGIPTWGTLIGFMQGELATHGMLSQPFTRERYWATPDGAWGETDGRRIPLQTRPTKVLHEAILHTTSPDYFSDVAKVGFDRLAQAVRMTRYGGECYAAAMLAAGYIDLNYEPDVEPHDVVALIPIIERSGGVISTLSGGRAESGGAILASANPWLHQQALGFLNPPH